VSGSSPQLISTTDLTAAQVRAVLDLVRDATRTDGVPPLREQVLLQLRTADAGRSVLAFGPDRDEPGLLGFAHVEAERSVEGPSLEIAVHPRARNRGIGTALLDEILAACPPPRPIRLWAHGQNAAAAQLARARGFLRVRHLYQMRRSLFAALPAVVLPAGLTIRSFDPDHDVPALQRLNAAAFTELPDQGGWSEDDIRLRMAEEWFDPEGLLLAESDRQLLGFHWTKAAQSQPADARPEGALGEVYVLGVLPHVRRGGLGRALTLAGLHHLRDQGLGAALLYVDASNVPAIGLYTSLGFAIWDSDMLFRR
jgi:mycothiol synthase